MGFVPLEKLTDVISNPYEAILVAAKDARIQNSINQLKDLDPNAPMPKMTTISLHRLINQEIEHYYTEVEPAGEAAAEAEDSGDDA